MAYQPQTEKKPFGDTMLEMMVRVFTMAAFLLVVTPIFIAPMLGVTSEDYASNEITWTLVSLVLGYIAAIPVSKFTLRSIKRGGTI